MSVRKAFSIRSSVARQTQERFLRSYLFAESVLVFALHLDHLCFVFANGASSSGRFGQQGGHLRLVQLNGQSLPGS